MAEPSATRAVPSHALAERGALTRAERGRRTAELLHQAHATEDDDRRSELLHEVILLNQCVAEAIANRYRGRGVSEEDLRQSAFEGLVKAVLKFDPAVRPDLLTYAVPTIRGEVQRWFRDQSWMVRPPRRLQELQWQVGRSVEALSQELGRHPTDGEVSADIGCSRDELDETLRSFGCFRTASIDRPVGPGGGDTLADLLETDGDEQSRGEARAILGPVVRRLPERDRRIVYLRFYEDQSQKEIGAELGVTQMQVSRVLARILRDLRRQIDDGAGQRRTAPARVSRHP